MKPFFLLHPVRRGTTGLMLGAALLTGCGPSGRCEGTVGGTRISSDIDGDSMLAIMPSTFGQGEGAPVRGAWLQLNYGDGSLKLAMALKLPAEQDTTALPLVMSQEELEQRKPQEGMVSMWKLQAPADAPVPSGGTVTVKLADANNLEGKIDALFEDGSHLECTYDVHGKNTVPGDDPTYSGPP